MAPIRSDFIPDVATIAPVVIAGGSGFLGVSLARHLASGGTPVVTLSRSAPKIAGPWKHVRWDGRTLDGGWASCLDGAAGLVNLTGRSVDCRKTPDNCDQILRSRVDPMIALGRALRTIASPPKVWVQMSTAHIHGDPETGVTESSPTGLGFAPEIGRRWEEAYEQAVLPLQRRVVLRTGFALGRERGAGHGALARLEKLARLGLGGTVGTGRQGMSWIHEHDLNRLFERGLRHPGMSGVYIASAPHPVTNREFMRELRRVAGGLGSLGIALPAAEWMVRFGARWLLNTDPDLALYGRFVSTQRLKDEGFEFSFPTLRAALAELYSRAPGSISRQERP